MEKIIYQRNHKETVSLVESAELPRNCEREVMIFPHEIQFFLNKGKQVYKREREFHGEIKVFYFIRVKMNNLVEIAE